MTREANSKADQSNTPEQQKKLQDKVEKCKQDVQKVCATALPRARGTGQGKPTDVASCPHSCPPPVPGLLRKGEDLQALLRVAWAGQGFVTLGRISPAARLISPTEALGSVCASQHGDPETRPSEHPERASELLNV